MAPIPSSDCPCCPEPAPPLSSGFCTEKTIDGGCYPDNYGFDQCSTHDLNFNPECAKNSPPSFCSRRLSYVDPENYLKPNNPSVLFPDSGLHYSYETCGNLNEYIRDFHATFLEQFQDGFLRVSFPNGVIIRWFGHWCIHLRYHQFSWLRCLGGERREE